MGKIKAFFHGVKKEAKRSHWPKGKELAKYSSVTIILILFFATFFFALDTFFAYLRGIIS